MMLATNKEIKSKEDVIQVARIYFPDGLKNTFVVKADVPI